MVRWILVLPLFPRSVVGCGSTECNCGTMLVPFNVTVVDAQHRPAVSADITVTNLETGETSTCRILRASQQRIQFLATPIFTRWTREVIVYS